MENLLLAKLPIEALARLRPHSERVTMRHGDYAIVPDEPIRRIYFPAGCLLSLVTTMRDGACTESGTIGREGMSGIPVLLDAASTPMPTFCQVPGEAIKVRSEAVKEAYENDRGVRSLFNRYVHAVVVNGSQSAACNALHNTQERFCRWLLMTSDGVGSDEFALTHEYLAVMMGVRRASVTEVAVKMRGGGLIDYRRGRVKILDREGLEACSCECYRRTKDEYERLFAT